MANKSKKKGNKREHLRFLKEHLKIINQMRSRQGTDNKTLTEDEWLSCQVDVNKLVKRKGEKSVVFSPGEAWAEKTSDLADTKANADIKLEQPSERTEEFKPEEKYTERNDIDENKKNILSNNTVDKWVIEKLLCRCCHAEGNFISLQEMDPLENVTYEHMLAACFGIQLSPEECASVDALHALCGRCAARLRDAHAFCLQVRACVTRFRTLNSNNGVRVAATVEIEVKEESSEVNDDVALGMYADGNSSDHLVEDKVMQKEQRSRKKVALTQQNDTSTDTEPSQPRKKPSPKRSSLKKIAPKQGGLSTTVINEYSVRVGDKYKCKQCEKVLCSSSGFYSHNRVVHLKIPYLCQLCNKPFETKLLRIKHKRKEHNIGVHKEQKIKCKACDRSFTDSQGLKLHMKSYHMLGEKLKCAMCDYECYNKKPLQRHMIKHKASKDFHCKYCKKSFLRKTTMQFHERIHTGDKRKVCAECGQAFVQKASLNYHMMKYHPDVKF